MNYDCIIVGGGIAGLQAAIQLGRYEHSVLVVDSGYGRSTLCRSYHNVLGWPEGVAGETLRDIGRSQAERLGVRFVRGEAVEARREGDGCLLSVRENAGEGGTRSYVGCCLLLATGLLDRIPPIPHLQPCLGISVYVCPDCDGYEVRRRKTLVLGSGDAGAGMALTLASRTDRLVYINHEQKAVKARLAERLHRQNIPYIEREVKRVNSDSDGNFYGVELADGSQIEGERGFVAFGGNEVKSDLARQLGVERMENRHIATDPRTKMTSVANVWAAGDVGVHSEQVTIAMGEGSQAAIWMHKALMKSSGR